MEHIDINVKKFENINEYYEKLEKNSFDNIYKNIVVKQEITIEKDTNKLNNVLGKRDKKHDTKKKLRINLYRQRGDCKLIKYILNKNNWVEVQDLKSADLLWAGKPILEEDFSMALETKISRIPGMQDLCHKKETGYILNKFREYFPDNFQFVPRTFLIPEEARNFEDFYSKKNKEKKIKQLFIAKPSNTCQGEGILLVKDIKEIPEERKGHVVQEYIEYPLLIDQKKFDLRLYILIASIDPFVCFLNEEGLARFATEDYRPPTKKNIQNKYMHLTNYSLNKMNIDKYVYTEETTLINHGTKRTLTSFWKSIEREGYSKPEIVESIEELLTNLLCSIYPFVRYNLNLCYKGKKVRPYQVLGIDIMLDSQLKPWLLELNSNPSFSINHDTEDSISPVDLFVKERVIEDALLIMKKSINKVIKIGRGEMYNSYKLLIDGKINEMKEMDLFEKLLEVYGALSGYKFKGSIGNSKFNKIMNYSKLLKDNINLVDLDMIFQRTSGKFMDFYSFIKAIELMAKKSIGYKDEMEKIEAVTKLVNSIEVK